MTCSYAAPFLKRPQSELPALYTGCVAGAALKSQLEAMLVEAGFEKIRIQPKDGGKREESERNFVISAAIEAIKP